MQCDCRSLRVGERDQAVGDKDTPFQSTRMSVLLAIINSNLVGVTIWAMAEHPLARKDKARGAPHSLCLPCVC